MRSTLFLAALSATALMGCAGDASTDTGAFDDDQIAADLWEEIAGYDSWSQTDEWTGVQPSGRVHGAYVQIWHNQLAFDNTSGEAPDGAISVKENYDAADGEPNKVFVQKKIAGYDPDNGDWFWARYSTDGTVETAGSVSGCYDCHAGATVDYRTSLNTFPAEEDTGDSGQ